MPQSTAQARQQRHAEGPLRRVLRAAVLGITLLFILTALLISSALVVYTAWLHHLKEGIFALIFAVLSAQIALNWILWKDDEEVG